MKKALIYSAILIISSSVFSCKKSGGASSSYITCTINGSAKTFNVTAQATKEVTNGVTSILITGFSAGSPTAATIELGIINDLSQGQDSIIDGNYTDTSSLFSNMSSYIPNVSNSNSEYGAGTSVSQSAGYDGVTIKNHLIITVTSISKTQISGTFSGDQFPNNDDTQAPISLTNGKFSVGL